MNQNRKTTDLTSRSECKRQNCVLREVGLNGAESCLMDSVRTKWDDPSAVNYCVDSTCNKFVDLINSKFMELKK